jgi:hypothetical protein
MAGFLDSKERIIDMVLTSIGKSLLLKGDLRFRYWIPFDDEVDYDPPNVTTRENQTEQERKLELIESPMTREATLGYRGLNFREEDTTNVYRPMFTAPPGVGHSYPVPRMVVSSGAVDISVDQWKVSKLYQQCSPSGDEILKSIAVDVGFQRKSSAEANIDAGYPEESFPEGTAAQGFLVTVYLSSSIKADELGQVIGGYQEVLHNRDAAGDITFRNDIKLTNKTSYP